MIHFIRKLRSTLRIAFTLALARTFGEYQHSVHDSGGLTYAIYRWRDQEWPFPTAPLEVEDDPDVDDYADRAEWAARLDRRR